MTEQELKKRIAGKFMEFGQEIAEYGKDASHFSLQDSVVNEIADEIMKDIREFNESDEPLITRPSNF